MTESEKNNILFKLSNNKLHIFDINTENRSFNTEIYSIFVVKH